MTVNPYLSLVLLPLPLPVSLFLHVAPLHMLSSKLNGLVCAYIWCDNRVTKQHIIKFVTHCCNLLCCIAVMHLVKCQTCVYHCTFSWPFSVNHCPFGLCYPHILGTGKRCMEGALKVCICMHVYIFNFTFVSSLPCLQTFFTCYPYTSFTFNVSISFL